MGAAPTRLPDAIAGSASAADEAARFAWTGHGLDALRCDPEIIRPLAVVSTRLSSPGPGVTERLVNWGYAVSDLSIRTHYRGFERLAPTSPIWPFPSAPLSRPDTASPRPAN